MGGRGASSSRLGGAVANPNAQRTESEPTGATRGPDREWEKLTSKDAQYAAIDTTEQLRLQPYGGANPSGRRPQTSLGAAEERLAAYETGHWSPAPGYPNGVPTKLNRKTLSIAKQSVELVKFHRNVLATYARQNKGNAQGKSALKILERSDANIAKLENRLNALKERLQTRGR